VEQRSVALTPPALAQDSLGFFRWGRVGDQLLLTNDAGEWEFLSDVEFGDLLAGRIGAEHPRFAELQRKGFLVEGLDLDALAQRVAQRTRHMRRGAHLHVVTLAGRSAGGGSSPDGMSAATAEKIVDLALQTTSPAVAFELQGHGGEPLLNFDVLRRLVEYAVERNKRAAGKTLTFRLLSNFSAMTEKAAQWLITNDVFVRTTFDGPPGVHDWNRKWMRGSVHADVVRWIEHFERAYKELGRDPATWQVDTLTVTTRRTIEAWREVVDEHVARGLRSICLRPLDAARFDRETWSEIGYTADEYLDFYRRVLDYVVELNGRGVQLSERLASIVAAKILTSEDPGVVDIQSPCGDGIGQIAYDVDGRLFPCDEARVLDALGDPIFALGRAGEVTLEGVVRHPTVRAIAAASLLDAQPMCADCWNKPFCGFSPVHNFVSQGDLFGQRPHCFECKEHMGVSRRLFELLSNDDGGANAELLKRWASARSRFATDTRTLVDAP
jgi:His-Xaa-Ser system radical SAM maturase HxsB